MTPSETLAPQDAVTNPAAQRLLRAQRREASGRILLPLAIVPLVLLGWEARVPLNGIPHSSLP
ncbi:MAG: ABC transporter permease, partial [Betaproteobacteria bacterium]